MLIYNQLPHLSPPPCIILLWVHNNWIQFQKPLKRKKLQKKIEAVAGSREERSNKELSETLTLHEDHVECSRDGSVSSRIAVQM
jgi:hypothetical protein